MYNANAVNSFSGNAFYYILKVMEVHNNRTGSAKTVTAEDDAVITRFTPADMEIANKAVCAQILLELDVEAGIISNTAACAQHYICEFEANRFPNYLFKVRCKTSRCSGNCSPENARHNMCQSHGIHVTVLQMRGDCEEWVWGEELLPIACICINDI